MGTMAARPMLRRSALCVAAAVLPWAIAVGPAAAEPGQGQGKGQGQSQGQRQGQGQVQSKGDKPAKPDKGPRDKPDKPKPGKPDNPGGGKPDKPKPGKPDQPKPDQPKPDRPKQDQPTKQPQPGGEPKPDKPEVDAPRPEPDDAPREGSGGEVEDTVAASPTVPLPPTGTAGDGPLSGVPSPVQVEAVKPAETTVPVGGLEAASTSDRVLDVGVASDGWSRTVLPLGAIALIALASALAFVLRRRTAVGVTPEVTSETLSIFRT